MIAGERGMAGAISPSTCPVQSSRVSVARILETKTLALPVAGRRNLLAVADPFRRAADRRRGYDQLRPGNAGCLGSQSGDGVGANPARHRVVAAEDGRRRFRLFRSTDNAEAVAVNLDNFLLYHDRLDQSNPALNAGGSARCCGIGAVARAHYASE